MRTVYLTRSDLGEEPLITPIKKIVSSDYYLRDEFWEAILTENDEPISLEGMYDYA